VRARPGRHPQHGNLTCAVTDESGALCKQNEPQTPEPACITGYGIRTASSTDTGTSDRVAVYLPHQPKLTPQASGNPDGLFQFRAIWTVSLQLFIPSGQARSIRPADSRQSRLDRTCRGSRHRPGKPVRYVQPVSTLNRPSKLDQDSSRRSTSPHRASKPVRYIASTWVQSRCTVSPLRVVQASPFNTLQRFSTGITLHKRIMAIQHQHDDFTASTARASPFDTWPSHCFAPFEQARPTLTVISPPAPSEQARPIQGSKSHLAAPAGQARLAQSSDSRLAAPPEQARSAQSSDSPCSYRPSKLVRHKSSDASLAAPLGQARSAQSSDSATSAPPGQARSAQSSDSHYVRTARASPFGAESRWSLRTVQASPNGTR
jgi:hypothetical protein